MNVHPKSIARSFSPRFFQSNSAYSLPRNQGLLYGLLFITELKLAEKLYFIAGIRRFAIILRENKISYFRVVFSLFYFTLSHTCMRSKWILGLGGMKEDCAIALKAYTKRY